MGMTIDNSICLLEKYLDWQKLNGFYGSGIDEATSKLLEVAKKYQKIEQILKEPCIIPEGCYPMLNKIERVVKEDGNDD